MVRHFAFVIVFLIDHRVWGFWRFSYDKLKAGKNLKTIKITKLSLSDDDWKPNIPLEFMRMKFIKSPNQGSKSPHNETLFVAHLFRINDTYMENRWNNKRKIRIEQMRIYSIYLFSKEQVKISVGVHKMQCVNLVEAINVTITPMHDRSSTKHTLMLV